jgi:hypothetical protein
VHIGEDESLIDRVGEGIPFPRWVVFEDSWQTAAS